MKEFSLGQILNMMAHTVDVNKMMQCNVYLQQVINAVMSAIAPELLTITRKCDSLGKIFGEDIMPSDMLNNSQRGKFLDNIIILQSVANWIDDDINVNDSDLYNDISLMQKLYKEDRADKHLTKAEINAK